MVLLKPTALPTQARRTVTAKYEERWKGEKGVRRAEKGKNVKTALSRARTRVWKRNDALVVSRGKTPS